MSKIKQLLEQKQEEEQEFAVMDMEYLQYIREQSKIPKENSQIGEEVCQKQKSPLMSKVLSWVISKK